MGALINSEREFFQNTYNIPSHQSNDIFQMSEILTI